MKRFPLLFSLLLSIIGYGADITLRRYRVLYHEWIPTQSSNLHTED